MTTIVTADATEALFVVKKDVLDDRWMDVPRRLGDYAQGSVKFLEAECLKTPFIVRRPAPALVVSNARNRADDDVDNAILLHSWLAPSLPTPRDARDNRLWTWLAHHVFPDYIRARWPIRGTDEQKMESVRNHWFLRGEGRGAVGRHALARLWWAAEATYKPERVDPIFASDVNDPYRFTRILLGVQNVNLQIRDRTFGSGARVLLSAIETLRLHGGDGGSVNRAAAVLGREINIVSRFRDLESQPPVELVALFRTFLPPVRPPVG